METRANYVLIGAFTLAAVVGAFLFVMWIAGYGAPGGHRFYQVVFNGSVSGLSNGANVLFNGIKVGEVTHLTFSRSDPHQVVADIDVNSDAPIDRNTKARLETQGLTGSGVVALLGGSTPGPELTGENGRPAVIYAEQTMQLQDILDNVAALSVRATSVLDDADKILADNSAPIHSAITNVDEFSKVLADNAPNVNAALKSVADLGKTLGPLSTRLQTLSDDADRLVLSIDTDKVRGIVDNVQSLSGKANTVLDRADKLLADNSDSGPFDDCERRPLRQGAGRQRVERRRGAEERGRSRQDDRAGCGAYPDPVRGRGPPSQGGRAGQGSQHRGQRPEPVGQASTLLDRADKILADNSDSIHSTLQNVDAFSKMLSDNSSNVDVTLKNLAELSKTVQPVVAQIQTLSGDADRVVKSVEPDQVHAIVVNAETFSRSLADSSNDYRTLVRDGAALATHLNDTSKRLDTALIDADGLMKAVDAHKIAGIVDAASDVAETVRQNRGNIDLTLKNFAELAAKLNELADKLDGLIASARSFLGSPGTKGAVDQVSEAAQSVRKLADDVDARVKEISVGLSRFSNSGLREYEALAIEGRRTLDDIDRAVRSLERNPGQVIFGSKPSLPEYHGGQ